MSGAADKDSRELVGIDVGVVGEYNRSSYGEHRIFFATLCLTDGYRRVVHRLNGNADCSNSRISASIIGFIGEAVRSVVVGCGQVAKRAVAIEIQQTMRWPADNQGC